MLRGLGSTACVREMGRREAVLLSLGTPVLALGFGVMGFAVSHRLSMALPGCSRWTS